MIRFFKRRKDKPSLMYPVFQRLSSAIDKRQRKWAAWLGNKTDKLPQSVKLYSLVVFCFLFGGGSVYLIVHAIGNKTQKLFIEKMSFPAYVIEKDSTAYLKQVPLLTEKEYQNIQRFKHYMDSLQRTPAGKATYDSIIKARPGLMDSIAFIEHLYHEQLKSK
jgi:hypothetical protein